LPVDKLSKVLVEILGSASTPSAEETLSGDRRSKTFHVVNPKASSWEADLASEMIASYPEGMVKPVSFENWVERLRESLEEAEKNGNVDAEVNPAIRLLEFYTKAAAGGNAEKKNRTLPTDISSATSKTLGALGPLNRAWMENWMVQWGIKDAVAAPAAPQNTFLALS
jgi:hypothetical protein